MSVLRLHRESLSDRSELCAHDEDELLDELWSRFKDDGDIDARNRLVEHYASLVRFVAARVASGLPASIDRNDLASYGVLGLMDALEKFDRDRGVKFETYAIMRIKGAIIDEIRSFDWVPRSVRNKAKAVERAYAELDARLQRPPTDAEVASELGITEDELLVVYSKISYLGVISLDEVVLSGQRGDDTTLSEVIPDQRQSTVGPLDERERTRMLTEALNRLGDREKTVILLYYYEGFTLKEIGQILGVTESRVCQIHAKAVLALRGKLADLMD